MNEFISICIPKDQACNNYGKEKTPWADIKKPLAEADLKGIPSLFGWHQIKSITFLWLTV